MNEETRWQPVAWIAAGVLAVLAATKLLSGGGHDQPPAAQVAVARHAEGRPGAGTRKLYVHVAGAVRQPGLYRVRDGSRVATAIDLAGGPARKAELGGINLAAPVQDGQQVVVPKRGAAPGAAAAASPGSGGAADGANQQGPISLGSATAGQLDQLDGIGPTLAKRIIEYRTEHGGFRSVSQLRQVDGIGEKRFEALRDAVGP